MEHSFKMTTKIEKNVQEQPYKITSLENAADGIQIFKTSGTTSYILMS